MKKGLAVLAALVVLLPLFHSCGWRPNASLVPETSFFAMDSVSYCKAVGAKKQDFDAVQQRIGAIEQDASATLPESSVTAFNAADAGVDVPFSPEIFALIQDALDYAAMTDGAFHPALGTVSKLWDITGDPHVPDADQLAETLRHTDFNGIVLSDGAARKQDSAIQLDLGGIAKGYAAQQAIAVLRERGIDDAMISLGGNIAVCGVSPAQAEKGLAGWKIGIRSPFDPQKLIGAVVANDTVISVSGDYERFFTQDGKRYHHIMDAKTGFPAQSGLRSVAVICRDGAKADALSTALFVMGKDGAVEFYQEYGQDFEAVLIGQDGDVTLTPGLFGNFEPEPNAVDKEGNPLTFEYLNSRQDGTN